MGGSAARLRDHGRIEPKILPRGAAGHPERPRPARRSGRGRAGSGTADRRRPRARWAGIPPGVMSGPCGSWPNASRWRMACREPTRG